jgi:hypothetical protein
MLLERELHLDQKVTFSIEFNVAAKENDVRIICDKETVGYVSRGLKDAFIDWQENDRIDEAVIEKINGTTQRPALYLFVRVKSAA